MFKKRVLAVSVLIIGALCIALASSAQTINNQWPTGKYKFGYSDVKQNVVLSLNLAGNNRYYSTLFYKNSSDTVRGSYKIMSDTIYFSPDIRYSSMPAYYKPGKGQSSQNIVIQLDSLGKYADTYLMLAVQPAFKKDKMQLIGRLQKKLKSAPEAEDDDDNETLQKPYYISLPKSDSLFLYSTLSYTDTTIYSLSIPKNADTLVVNCKNILTSDGNKFAPIKCYKGESANELVFVSPSYPNLYYANAFLEKDLPATLPQADPRYASFFSIENIATTVLIKQTETDYAVTDTSYAATVEESKDTIPYYRSYNKALANANINNKYVLMYYQSGALGGSAKKQLKELEESANRYQTIKTFNNKFSVFIANDTDKLLFRDYGVKKFPALVITDNTGKALYTSYGYYLSDFSNDFAYSESYSSRISMLKQLSAHEINTVEAESVKASDSKDLITRYLKDVESTKNITVDSYAGYVEESNKTKYKSKLQLTYDTALVYKCIDKLISQTPGPDTTLAQFIIDFYPTEIAASYLAKADTAGDKKTYDKAFKYLVHNYNDLSKYAYNITSDYYATDSTLYAYLSKSINNISSTYDNYAATSGEDISAPKELLDTAICNQLLLRRYFIEQVPAIAHFQMPLLLSALDVYADSLNMSGQFINWSREYCNALITNASGAKKTIDSLNNVLYAQMYNEYIVAMPSNAYSIINTDDYSSEQSRYLNKADDDNKSQPIYFRAIYANIFNNCAWYFYKHKQSEEYLKEALKWSKASLTLEPKSPYYLDTYAHLLYVTGSKAEALQYQQRAIDESNNKQSKYYIDKDTHKTMVKDLAKMQTGREL